MFGFIPFFLSSEKSDSTANVRFCGCLLPNADQLHVTFYCFSTVFFSYFFVIRAGSFLLNYLGVIF